MKKKIYLAMLAVCFALTASACGDDGAVITDGTKTEGAADGKKAETGTTRLVSVENVEKYITIGEYKGLTLDNTVDAITDDDVQAQIDEDLKDKAEPVSDAAKEGDLVTVNYTGTKDGQTFDGGTANNYDFVIGDGQMFEEFENGVIGMKKGDTRRLKLIFRQTMQTKLWQVRKLYIRLRCRTCGVKENLQMNGLQRTLIIQQ